MVTFSARNANIYKIRKIRGYIFRILQHFATKICNSTNFKMLSLTVVKDFVFPA